MERWLRIPGFEDYDVSDHGRVRNRRTRIPVTPITNNSGELRVILRKNNLRYSELVGRLVLEAFKRSEPDMDIKYLDNNPCNVCLANLVYCEPTTEKEDNASRNDLRRRFGKRVRNIDTGEMFESIHECSKKTGLDRSNIIKCLNGTNHTCGGYRFELINQ
jgi:hypothetical protein